MNKLKKETDLQSQPKSRLWQYPYISFPLVIFGIALFLFSIDLMGTSLRHLGSEAAESILLATSNPFIGLFIGLLITAIIQSSSTSTAMIVAVVASGSLSFSNAVPMIMGANIGTTITSTIVSLGFITYKKEFRKAISAGTVHDFYNIFIAIILFPLEYYYDFVSYMAINLKDLILPDNPIMFRPGRGLSTFINPFSQFFIKIFPHYFWLLLFSFFLLFLSIKIISSLIYKNYVGGFKKLFKKYIFKNHYKSFSFGVILTAAVQSSSITTSLIVPIVATGKLSLKKVFPFIMGANLGTTITALLAALFRSEAAIAIALVHLVFNLFGALIFLPFQVIRRIPVLLASKFGKLTMNYRIIGFVYIIFTFFIIPFALIYFNKDEDKHQEVKSYHEDLYYPEEPIMMKSITNRTEK